MKLSAFFRFLAAIVFSLLVQSSFGQSIPEGDDPNLPPGWPWRGITIDSMSRGNSPAFVGYLKSQGANAVELVLVLRDTAKYKKKSPAEVWDETIQWADWMLDACRDNGMVAMLSVSQFPVDPAYNLTQASPEFWGTPAHLEEVVEIAERLAQHFKDRGRELGAYEFLNEPLVRSSGKLRSPKAWPALMGRLVEAVRKHDPDRHIVLTAGFGGEASYYRTLEKPLPYERIIYGAHVYNPHEFTHQGIADSSRGKTWPGYVGIVAWDKDRLKKQLSPLIEFRKKYNVPVLVGEFSAVRWAEGASQWICDAASLFDENGFGWMYFAFNGYHGWNPNYDAIYSSNDPADFEKRRVGDQSERWRILRSIYARRCKS